MKWQYLPDSITSSCSFPLTTKSSTNTANVFDQLLCNYKYEQAVTNTKATEILYNESYKYHVVSNKFARFIYPGLLN